jgi:hypothetical protein
VLLHLLTAPALRLVGVTIHQVHLSLTFAIGPDRKG